MAESLVGCALSGAHARTMRIANALVLGTFISNAIVAILDLFARLSSRAFSDSPFQEARECIGDFRVSPRMRNESRRFSQGTASEMFDEFYTRYRVTQGQHVWDERGGGLIYLHEPLGRSSLSLRSNKA